MSQGERFDPSAAIHVILAVLDALSCAHVVGIVHRDIKPGNILLMSGGRVKVTDFGVARLDSSNLTLDGMVIGTPRYMSPEQCCGGAVDQRSDLFSVAIVLQEMLTGERPFPGKNLTEIAFRLLREPPVGGDTSEVSPASLSPRSSNGRWPRRRKTAMPPPATWRRPCAKRLRDPRVRRPERTSSTRPWLRSVADEPSQQPTGQTAFDPELLSNIERRLARRVGPIARYLVQTSLPAATSLESLCDALAQQIDRAEDRRQFLSEALDSAHSGATTSPVARSRPAQSAPQTAISPDEIERARRALAETLGPIAKVLVQRALMQAHSSQELWDLLASHIDAAAARADFIRRRDLL